MRKLLFFTRSTEA